MPLYETADGLVPVSDLPEAERAMEAYAAEHSTIDETSFQKWVEKWKFE